MKFKSRKQLKRERRGKIINPGSSDVTRASESVFQPQPGKVTANLQNPNPADVEQQRSPYQRRNVSAETALKRSGVAQENGEDADKLALYIGEIISVGGDELEEKADILLGCLENELDMLRLGGRSHKNVADELLLLSRIITLNLLASNSPAAAIFIRQTHVKFSLETSIFPPTEGSIKYRMIEQAGFPVFNLEGDVFAEVEFWGGVAGLLSCAFQENFDPLLGKELGVDNGFDLLKTFFKEMFMKDSTGYFKKNVQLLADEMVFKEPLMRQNFDYRPNSPLYSAMGSKVVELILNRYNALFSFPDEFVFSRQDFLRIKRQLVKRTLTKNKIDDAESYSRCANYFMSFKMGEIIAFIDARYNMENLRERIDKECYAILIDNKGYLPVLAFIEEHFNLKKAVQEFNEVYKLLVSAHEEIRRRYEVSVPNDLTYQFFLEELKKGNTYKMKLPKKQESITQRSLSYSERQEANGEEAIAEMLVHYCWYVRRRTGQYLPQGKTYLKLLRDHSLEDIRNTVESSPYRALTPHVSVPKDDNFWEGD